MHTYRVTYIDARHAARGSRLSAVLTRLTLLYLPCSLCPTLSWPCVMCLLLFGVLSPCSCGCCLADGAGADGDISNRYITRQQQQEHGDSTPKSRRHMTQGHESVGHRSNASRVREGVRGRAQRRPRRDRTRYVQTYRAIIDIHGRPHALGARLTLLWLPCSMCRTLCCPCVMGRLLFCMLSPCCCGRCLADGAGADVAESVVALRHVARAVSHAVSMLLRLLSG